jgi:PAS domain S-box-containing protein
MISDSQFEMLMARLTTIETSLAKSNPSVSAPQQDSFFRVITETTSDIIIECTTDGIIEFISQSVHQLGYAPQELVGTSGIGLIHQDDQADFASVLSNINTLERTISTIQMRSAGGAYVYMECRINCVQQDRLGNGGTMVIIVARDITKRLSIVRELQESVSEKEVLLKEIHHRVKNNLQIISSMLSIQGHYFGDPAVQEVFRECQNRIKSMGLIHETLYMSKNLAAIEFSTYIHTLVNRLSSSYREAAARVIVHVDIPELTLHIDTAIACGLIVNELITNCFKYAFPDDRTGEIWITMIERDTQLALTVRDNGIGFPKEIDLAKSNSMGLQLVTTLSHQLDADLELDKVNGTSFTLVFSDQRGDQE